MDQPNNSFIQNDFLQNESYDIVVNSTILNISFLDYLAAWHIFRTSMQYEIVSIFIVEILFFCIRNTSFEVSKNIFM